MPISECEFMAERCVLAHLMTCTVNPVAPISWIMMANSLCDSIFHTEIEGWKIKQDAQSLPNFPPYIPFFTLLAYSDTLRHSFKKPDHRSARKSQPGLLSPSQHSPPQPRATQSETRTSVGRRQSFTVCGYVPLSFLITTKRPLRILMLFMNQFCVERHHLRGQSKGIDNFITTSPLLCVPSFVGISAVTVGAASDNLD
jgi:hypothetical protein